MTRRHGGRSWGGALGLCLLSGCAPSTTDIAGSWSLDAWTVGGTVVELYKYRYWNYGYATVEHVIGSLDLDEHGHGDFLLVLDTDGTCSSGAVSGPVTVSSGAAGSFHLQVENDREPGVPIGPIVTGEVLDLACRLTEDGTLDCQGGWDGRTGELSTWIVDE